MLFRRLIEPEFSIVTIGKTEEEVYRKAEVKISQIDRFIQDNDLDRKMEKFWKEENSFNYTKEGWEGFEGED